MSNVLSVVQELDLGKIKGGKGARIFIGDEEYIDMFCDNGVVSLGYNYQPAGLPHTPGMLNDDLRDEAAERLCFQSGLDYAFFSNSGTESVEAMIKFARKAQEDRQEIYFLDGTFHGRTYGTMSADFTGKSYHLEGFEPFLPGIMRFKKIEDINPEAVAVIITPAEVYGDFIKYPEKFINDLVDYCDENDILLGFDEVQTYLRTGEWFGYEMYEKEFKPDMIAMAKGVAGGLPTGVTLVNEKIGNKISMGSHYSTFGGNRRSAQGIIDVHKSGEDIRRKVKLDGDYIKKRLKKMDVKNIRGEGLILAFDVDEPLKLRDKCLKENVILGVFSNNQSIKLTPPLVITRSVLVKALDVIEKCL